MQNHKAKNSSSGFWNPEHYVDWNWFQILKNLYAEQKMKKTENLLQWYTSFHSNHLKSNGICAYNLRLTFTNKNVLRWKKIDQLDDTCFIISLFTAQPVSNVSTSIFRSLRLTVDLSHGLYCSGSMCVGVTVWFGWGGVVSLCRPKQSHKDVPTWCHLF